MSQDKKSNKATIFGSIGAAGYLALKLKGFAWLLPSLITMVASIGVYTMMFGFSYAIAIVVLILIHEMGHWIWMKATGLDPKAPFFLPGIGAFVAMQKLPPDEAGRAWVAFAGPLIGGIGSAVLFWAGMHTGNDWLIAAGNTGFFLNLIQLIPAKPFDGGFVVGAITKWLLVPGTAVLVVAALMLQSTLLLIIAVISVLSLFRQLRSKGNEGVMHKSKQEWNQASQTKTLKELEESLVAPQAQPSGSAGESPEASGAAGGNVGAGPGVGATTGAGADSAQSPLEMVPASMAQRVCIGVAYLSLCGMLAYLFAMTAHMVRR